MTPLADDNRPANQAPGLGKPPALTPEQLARRRKRNIAMAVVLLGLVILFYAVTIAKLGPGVLNRPL
jgi:hypothetical protein